MIKLMRDTKSCTCKFCISACKHKPGWFLPGEMEKAAKLVKMSVKAFFKRYIGVDYWMAERDRPTTFVLAPRVVGSKGGTEYGSDPRGRCVFLKKGRCSIYAARPYECRVADHQRSPKLDGRKVHLPMVDRWMPKQNQIRELLGREPEQAYNPLAALFAALFGLP